jgi:hypothetical protein
MVTNACSSTTATTASPDVMVDNDEEEELKATLQALLKTDCLTLKSYAHSVLLMSSPVATDNKMDDDDSKKKIDEIKRIENQEDRKSASGFSSRYPRGWRTPPGLALSIDYYQNLSFSSYASRLEQFVIGQKVVASICQDGAHQHIFATVASLSTSQ